MNTAPDYVPIAEARAMPGLRLVLTAGVPGPWSVAAKAILDVKGVPYTAASQIVGDANAELEDWTGHTNAPIAIYNDERARTVWAEILLLAERLKPEPSLIPASAEQRALMFGLAHEICGEQGLGWTARIILFAAQAEAGMDAYAELRKRYSSGEDLAACITRLKALIGMFERQMERQDDAGSDYLIGDSLTALDIYWMAFSNLLHPMSEELCEMPEFYRGVGPMTMDRLQETVPPILLEHRDRTARRHFALPLAC